jgi:hypothetical protein
MTSAKRDITGHVYRHMSRLSRVQGQGGHGGTCPHLSRLSRMSDRPREEKP